MTICSKMYEALDKRLEEKKSLDEIGSELCDAVIDPRGKAIRLIKQSKGEKYLKDNAEWLGYEDPRNPSGSNQKNLVQNPEQDLYDDARNNGFKVDSFGQNEIIYEKSIQNSDEQEQSGDLCSFGPVPLKEVLQERNAICPCGCGYGYDEEKRKWYTQKQMVSKHVI